MFGTGQLPKFARATCSTTTDGRWLIPTAEVPLTNLVREQIIAEEELPLRLTALTPCFRSEAGASGRDTRGMIRQHQFYKVELVSITTPETVRRRARAHGRLRRGGAEARWSCRSAPCCSAPATWASARARPTTWRSGCRGQETYREISSCSNCGDFQARRMDARYQAAGEKGTRFVHTLNGSGLAVGRTLVAVMENYQDEDGRIADPARAAALHGRALTPHRARRTGLMRILLTNDDGIHAEGLAGAGAHRRAAFATTSGSWRRRTSSPGASRAADPDRAAARAPGLAEKRFAVDGHADRLRDAGDARHLVEGTRPDLVLSGVNRGQNVAEDVTYSGTVAGAMEGTILNVKSIALSQAYGPGGRSGIKWHCAAHHGPKVIAKILETGIEPGILVNVNFPDCEPDAVVGIAIAAQGQRNQALLAIDARQDGRGNPYFWLAFAKARFEPGHGSDLKAIAENRISVTPLRLDLTDEPTLTRFAQAFAE